MLVRGLAPQGSEFAIFVEGNATDASQIAGLDAVLPANCASAELRRILADVSTRSRQVPSPRCANDDESVPVVDMDAALGRMAGNHELLADLIRFFFEDAFELLAKLRSAITRQDREQACCLAHSLKGLTSNFSAARAVAALQAIETCDADGESLLPEQLCEVDRQIARVVVALAWYGQAIST